MVDISKLLRTSGDDVVVELFQETNDASLRKDHVTFSYVGQGQHVQCTLAARVLTEAGGVGIYKGAVTVSYKRADIATVLPNGPEFIFSATLPFTFKQLKDYLKANYGLVLENADVLAPGATTAVTDATQYRAEHLDGVGRLVLRIADHSPRFLPFANGGSGLLVKPVDPNGGQLDMLGATTQLNPATSLDA